MIKVVEWFGGIGAATAAIKRLGINHNIIDYVELDKHAVKSYNAINNTDFLPTDINNVDINNYGEVDLLIAGWPCQDYSTAGLGAGLDGTRSSLILLTIDKIAQMQIKPKHILLENVKGLLSAKHKDGFELIKSEFEKLGYQWSQALLNTKYFGVPQNRDRVFMLLTRSDLPKVEISHLEQINTVDKVLKDILDFSLPTEEANISNNEVINGKVYIKNTMSQYTGKDIEIDIDKLNNQKREEINKVATLGEIINAIFNDITFISDKHFMGINGVGRTIDTGNATLRAKPLYIENNIIHYRKLSSLECWRLMGFNDNDYLKVKAANVSDSQLCKQAGNSIVVNCLEAIFKELLWNDGNND